ncbi:MAG TPA: hypothetical protein VFQ16_01515 [Burkholderiaceae bacterium]|nr:hypothetical protein [Burkholderiaceae bacterium]
MGIVGTAVLAAGGAAVYWAMAPAWHANRLQPPGRLVFRAVALAVLDGSLPGEASSRMQALESHLTHMETTIAALPPATQRELDQLLGLLASPPGRRLLAGLSQPWDVATIEDVRQSLQLMRESTLAVRRQAYHALRDLTHAAFFADEQHWALLGYPGPRALG